ncbi:MAG: Eco57I restriction-modification methylase domain-containing protein [Bacteroidaceae bacterium]|nr:Eco57I restriction-modification methylase domain-containing protein [Bacteroidaceae bacterium]
MPNKEIAPPLVDIREDNLLALSAQVVDTLLRDHTTGKNIFWATHDYEALGSEYDYRSEILPHLITGEHGTVIRPRVLKTKGQQTDRVKDMAEVFTPSWVVKMMVNNLNIDIDTLCLELTCGEAPFLVSRYDATTGEPIAINERVGILDRKLRLVNDQQLSDADWLAQIRQAFQSTYGYEWQGDSLLLARENLLNTFVDYYVARFGFMPDTTLLQDYAEIISWNFWQMDGLTYRTPREKYDLQPQAQLSFFDETPIEAPAPLCVIKDWEKEEVIKVNEIQIRQIKNQNIMKFDVIIGNPPYQEEMEGTSDSAIYNFFMDEGYKIGSKVEFITPARFLFNAGKTPKYWNRKMLNDPHLKVLYYEQDSSKVFSNTDIKGGVAVTYRNEAVICGAIEVFTSFVELNTIRDKVTGRKGFQSFSELIYAPESYKLTDIIHEENPDVRGRLSRGHDFDIVTNIFSKLPDIFLDEKPSGNEEYVGFIGLEGNKRYTKYVKKRYVRPHGNLEKWKIILPKSNGSGAIGEVLSTPLIGTPLIGHTQSFISIGAFETEAEANAALKYVKSKFARTMLGILKITQDNKKGTWKFVPLQDFSPSSDIDWSKSIAEIDEQLFDKYGLDEQERNFIRTKVKEMA